LVRMPHLRPFHGPWAAHACEVGRLLRTRALNGVYPTNWSVELEWTKTLAVQLPHIETGGPSWTTWAMRATYKRWGRPSVSCSLDSKGDTCWECIRKKYRVGIDGTEQKELGWENKLKKSRKQHLCCYYVVECAVSLKRKASLTPVVLWPHPRFSGEHVITWVVLVLILGLFRGEGDGWGTRQGALRSRLCGEMVRERMKDGWKRSRSLRPSLTSENWGRSTLESKWSSHLGGKRRGMTLMTSRAMQRVASRCVASQIATWYHVFRLEKALRDHYIWLPPALA